MPVQEQSNYLNYRETFSKAQEIDKCLLATDERFRHSVQVICDDGSTFFWRNAFMEDTGDWLMVFTEHYGFHVYCVEDLIGYSEYERI